ncbi:DUF6962 family protein [Reichenbachiella versicolor]|uniref:DUF6962 family protein n=1 Tax=Reichenbachiella versicolor TaxID=1821036 RepID=UPI000D6DF24A|nr:hypothetical protein [Reichenbachiella versicolor]
MEKIVFEYFGIVMMEPMALLFNWLIAIQCFIYAKRIKQFDLDTEFAKGWYRFFLFFGFSTAFGGLSHFFFHYTGMIGKLPSWSFAVLMITYLELAVSDSTDKKDILKKVIWVSSLFLFVLMIMQLDFLWVSIHTAIGLLFFLGLISLVTVRKGDDRWKEYLYGVFFMFLTLPFVAGKIDPHIWFNRHDVSHLLMMVALFFFEKSTIRILKSESSRVS